MKCPACNFIFFRSAKKCPSCGGGLTRAAYAEQPDEEFTIYAATAGGLGLSDTDSFDTGEELGGSLYAETQEDPFGGEEELGNFNLDLSDLEAPIEPVAAEPAEPEIPVEDTLNFDLGAGEFSDVDVDGLGIDLEPVRSRLDRPALLQDAGDHVEPMPRRQPRVGVLPSSVSHEPSRVWGELSETHSLTRRAHLTGGSPQTRPTGTTSPVVTTSLRPMPVDDSLLRAALAKGLDDNKNVKFFMKLPP